MLNFVLEHLFFPLCLQATPLVGDNEVVGVFLLGDKVLAFAFPSIEVNLFARGLVPNIVENSTHFVFPFSFLFLFCGVA